MCVKVIPSHRWDVFETRCRMWADAQRDGRPAEYRWRPLRKFRNSIPCKVVPRRKHWLTPTARVPCINSARRTQDWTQSWFCSWQNSVRGQDCKSPRKCIYIVYIGVNATGDTGDASPAIFGQPRAGLTSMPVMPWHGASGSGGASGGTNFFLNI